MFLSRYCNLGVRSIVGCHDEICGVMSVSRGVRNFVTGVMTVVKGCHCEHLYDRIIVVPGCH